jgi:hypothetical protein
MKVFVTIIKEIEVDDRFKSLVDIDEPEPLNYHELHEEFCTLLQEKMELPLGSNATDTTTEWIEDAHTEDWLHCLFES